jgi:hypothetical protein
MADEDCEIHLNPTVITEGMMTCFKPSHKDMEARLLAAERERDEYKLAATSKIEALVLAISRRDALAETFGPLMNEADWHVEGCDCAGCKWFERARAALQALRADTPHTETRDG